MQNLAMKVFATVMAVGEHIIVNFKTIIYDFFKWQYDLSVSIFSKLIELAIRAGRAIWEGIKAGFTGAGQGGIREGLFKEFGNSLLANPNRNATIGERMDKVGWGEGWSGLDTKKVFKGFTELKLNLDLAGEGAEEFAAKTEQSGTKLADAANNVGQTIAEQPVLAAEQPETETTDVTTAALKLGTSEAFEAAFKGSSRDRAEKQIADNTSKTNDLLATQTDVLGTGLRDIAGALDLETVSI
jgi:hypothetical protein